MANLAKPLVLRKPYVCHVSRYVPNKGIAIVCKDFIRIVRQEYHVNLCKAGMFLLPHNKLMQLPRVSTIA